MGFLPLMSGGGSGFADKDAMEELGIFNRKKNYIWIKGRLLFPITIDGEIVALAGRHIPREREYKQPVRYINSGRTELFHRNEVVYGLDVVDDVPTGNLFVVEGYADVWSLDAVDVPAVAIMSDRLTQSQSETLTEFALKRELMLTIAFDGDNGGMRGEDLAVATFLQNGVKAVSLGLPSGDVSSAVSETDLQASEKLYDHLNLLERFHA